MRGALENAFEDCSARWQVHAGAAARSAATCAVALVLGGSLFSAHVGDCRAVLCRGDLGADPRAPGEEGPLAVTLTAPDHVVDVEDERERAIEEGAAFTRDGAFIAGPGGARFRTTRCFGAHLVPGLHATPDVSATILRPDDAIIAAGDAAVWRTLTAQEATEEVLWAVRHEDVGASLLSGLAAPAAPRTDEEGPAAVVLYLTQEGYGLQRPR